MKSTPIKQALQYVADNPMPEDDNWLLKPTHELVCRTLFDIANHPDPTERGALTRANTARKMIFDRLVGKRRPGSHPATRNVEAVEFVDLTKGEIE